MGKALNHNAGKPRPSLVLRDMAEAFHEVVSVAEMGAQKYERKNWAESIATDEATDWVNDSMDSIQRHLLAFEQNENRDDESGYLHLAHVACRAMMMCEYLLAEESR